jgi:membrane-bound metal-dependent hydrolase YbcI (DUF457 family)
MREPGHIAGGYLVTRQLVKQWQLSEAEKNRLLALGAAAATLPDVDVLLYVLKTRSLELSSDFDHHKWVTHTFPFYLVPGALVYLYARTAGRTALRRTDAVVTVAACVTPVSCHNSWQDERCSYLNVRVGPPAVWIGVAGRLAEAGGR